VYHFMQNIHIKFELAVSSRSRETSEKVGRQTHTDRHTDRQTERNAII